MANIITDSQSWYSKQLFIENEDQRKRVILEYVIPLLEKIEQKNYDYHIHFFQYYNENGHSIRLRIRGEKEVIKMVSTYENEYDLDFKINFKDESTEWQKARKNKWESEQEFEEAMMIYEFISRFSMNLIKNGVYINNEIIEYNHLFLNALSFSVLDEYFVHERCLWDRMLVNLMIKENKTEEWVRINYSEEIQKFEETLSKLKKIFQEAYEMPNKSNDNNFKIF